MTNFNAMNLRGYSRVCVRSTKAENWLNKH